jgi:DNA repair exonuclease SbcCD ATPase subunit
LNEVLGGGDSIGAMFADMGMQMLNTVFQTIALQAQLNAAAGAAKGLGAALNSAMGVIGWIVMGVNLIVQGLTAVFNAKDKRLSNQIKTLTRNVEDLDRALAKLEDRIDSAFSLTGVSLGTKDAIKNLQSQIYSYERMIKLDKDKKKTDTDAIRQYENAIEDLKDKQRELEKELVSTATSGILDSTRDAARQFVDAWYEAFDETGDGLQGLKDNFKEIMLDMIQQQASMTIAGNFLNRWKAQLDKYINPDDLELSTKEASNWMRSVQEELPMLNEALQNYFTAMEQAGIDLSETSELSGLQRGIQSVTEETAQALEALLNSTRFFVADSNAKLTLLVDSFTNPESANPMLSELRSQTDLIRTIRDMFSSVIGRGDSTHSGAYLKVVM